MKAADRGLSDLGSTVDTVISVPNDKLIELVPKGTSFFEAFRVADDILRQAVQGISDIITTPGLINRDFSDIRAIMLGMGYAMMGTATASGDKSSIEAARQAISCPLMEEGGVKGARGVLINITGSSRLSLHDVNEACSLIRTATDNEEAQINFGVVLNESMGDEVKITVIATGFQRETLPHLTSRRADFIEPIIAPAPPPPAPEPIAVAAEASAGSLFHDSAPVMPSTPPIVDEPPPAPPDDLDVPAYLRRDRRLYQ